MPKNGARQLFRSWESPSYESTTGVSQGETCLLRGHGRGVTQLPTSDTSNHKAVFLSQKPPRPETQALAQQKLISHKQSLSDKTTGKSEWQSCTSHFIQKRLIDSRVAAFLVWLIGISVPSSNTKHLGSIWRIQAIFT